MEDGNNLYSLYWSTNENRGAYQVDVAEENLPNFTTYKFCSKECVTNWAFPDGVIPDHRQEAENILDQVNQFPETRLQLKGFHLGMDISAAVNLLNYYTCEQYRAHRHRRYPESWVLKNTSDGDWPGNYFIFRTLKQSEKVSEIYISSDLATRICEQAPNPESIQTQMRIPYLLEASFPFYEGLVGLGPWQSRNFYQYRNEHFEELILLGNCDRFQNQRTLVAVGGIYMRCLKQLSNN